ncbi:FAD-dependent oxidoreductase [Demequina sp. B12]|uniref:protoporphyrinogen/coproporphyrinogen oxidase n=1 Tax=Demequina sp. B12 TaxID=2992757 RepID=UPI00237AAC5F|nr:FAD-dependent oxidoreductase [Demequina sp. B12]MDE0573802.1 FAD-dependent oxidoreductase [Demequina sp. B12]
MSVAKPRTWIVIGAGPAGLLAARRLASYGHDVTVLEAESEVGGRVSRTRVDGLDMDAGAESFATRGGYVETLVRDLGLGDKLVTPAGAPAWVVSPDRAYPMPSAGWLGVPTVSLARDVRKALGWSGALRAAVERFMPPEPIAPDDSLGKIARKRLGDAAVDRLMSPVVSGIFSRPVDDLRIDAAAAGLAAEVSEVGLVRAAARRRAAAPAGSAVMGLDGGIFQLTHALAAQAQAAGVRIVTDAPVYSLTRKTRRWNVVTDGHKWKADAVVVAASRPVAAALVPQIERAPDKQVALVTLSLDAPALDRQPRGSGVLAVGDVTRAKALTHASAKWAWVAREAPERHLVRLSYNLETAEDLSPHAVADASRLLGVELTDAQVRDLVQVTWHDAAPTRPGDREPVPGLHLVGAAAGFSGLAAIVDDDARSTLGAPEE